jgi:hypothetical protein
VSAEVFAAKIMVRKFCEGGRRVSGQPRNLSDFASPLKIFYQFDQRLSGGQAILNRTFGTAKEET